ncbi:WASH complex subunit 3 [Coccinella septempunctata]|uniref:WASH complex subunit 3 n=1 Tax=Coccinella septempunctata TaxID=41139 RepID=UPI001D093E19|nr:WASH complex subunit 3 [Coccinella septempunctata]
MDAPLLLNPDVDYNKALPIQQKRIIAFINHFIMNTVSFLNTFAQSCESRLMEFEFKLNKVDASLKILESQLSSIPDENFRIENDSIVENDPVQIENSASDEILPEIESVDIVEPEESKPSNNPIYSKYFKMVQVGVPAQAVKLKMMSDGLDPNVLDQV